ncbi:alpha/beta fold hydrolase [Mycetocola zhadangensis]|uniref:Alpha/beta hydrolase n=1 Tax=Mycetocola zhadangensis TaxID=1164595 RepID=A0A3L7J8J9_9MICO|nr:alpha/beta hydrolase [Mycetocola zhadangensis]RLQ85781.1 alpha/beta hydrolase [Mycetocola zhadangensis]GGE85732.1 hypothetical protein GCM10011313_05270 [Mycetocola zhadangensis]
MNTAAAHLSTGVTVPYFEQGQRGEVPLILLHGWGESAAAFDRFLLVLPHRFHVFAFDQRGYGGATKPQDGYTLDDAAADVLAFLDVIGAHSAILIGSSSGGYVAQQVAVSRPERVAALVLVGSPLTLSGQAPFAEVDMLTDPVDPAWVRKSLDWFPLSVPVPAWYLDDRVRDGLRMPARVWKATLAGLTAARQPTEAGRIDCPALIIRGGADEIISRRDHEALSAAISGSRLVVYANCGHLVLWEQPQRVASDVAVFLDAL